MNTTEREELITEINLFRKEVEQQQKKFDRRFESLLIWAKSQNPELEDDSLFDYIYNQFGKLNNII